MVLRSGIIIPFQFRDSKKLLMIGVPEENRNLNIWDLRNVVRAAFGIYNFEFRNKKIGFNIPDELLLHYLAQRRDLTNFVIEVGQADPSDVVQDNGLVDSSSTENFTTTGSSLQMNESMHMPETPGQEYRDSFDSKQIKYTDALTNSDVRNAFTSASQSLDKECGVYEGYAEQTQSTPKLHPIGEEHAADKCEQGDCGIEQNQKPKKQPPEVDPIQRQLNAGSQIFCPRQTFELRDDNDIHLKKINYQQHQYASCAMNRFRRRGERMSKDQKEVYVKYFEENPCMLSQRRNDTVLESHWNKLAAILNNVPQGAVKNVEEWKQTFDAWRYRVFMYYRYNYKLAGSVTHNVKNFKPLTSTDQRAYSMWTSYKSTPPQQADKPDPFCKSETVQTNYNY
ncbi:uncharacterized protein LOC101461444 isoform X1 [Ceratitis capitata]|uniref:uncharacterized protein LOC101461444 isoform X1 n=1 Tax=Ceratitis capitata TaxID=7213 RepID=UPI000618916E|nr:uncharacterized protein LOC101461444 isoform X1 [Ceratitis capitata]